MFTRRGGREDRFLLWVTGMTALLSALVGVATILGFWCAVSVVSVPILVLCVRSQERSNARLTARMRRAEWASGSR
jgi:hypothetical protein